MPDEETREAIRTGRKELKAAAGKTAGGNAAKFVAAPAAETSPLEDPEKQDEILNPAPIATTIGGEPVEVHELAVRYSRALAGLIHAVVIEMFTSAKPADGATFSVRLAGLVAERYGDRIIPFIARATKPAGEVTDAEMPELVASIDEAMRYDELVKILVVMLTANKTLDALTPHKNGAVRKNG